MTCFVETDVKPSLNESVAVLQRNGRKKVSAEMRGEDGET